MPFLTDRRLTVWAFAREPSRPGRVSDLVDPGRDGLRAVR